MRTSIYFFVLMLLVSAILIGTSCNYLKPVEGNGKVVKIDKDISDDITYVEVEGNLSVTIRQDSLSKVSIETDENLVDYIDIKVSHQKLIIKNKRKLLPVKGINVYLTVGSLRQMDLSGAVVLRSAGKINFDTFKMKLSGASNVLMDLNCFTLDATCSGSCTLKLIGAANDVDMDISGACEIDNSQLIVENMNLEVSGATYAKVNVLNKLDVKATGAAKVEYLGTPEVTKKISGAGLVEKIF